MKIRVTRHFNAFGPAFEGIEEGQEHTVLKEDGDDIWIQGNGEPIKLLGPPDERVSEYKIIEE